MMEDIKNREALKANKKRRMRAGAVKDVLEGMNIMDEINKLNPEGAPPQANLGAGLTAEAAKTPKANENPLLKPDYCGSCYGAETNDKDADIKQCCNTCDEVKAAYARQGWGAVPNDVEQCFWAEDTMIQLQSQLDKRFGCRLSGSFKVPKANGNFQFTADRSFSRAHRLTHDFDAFDKGMFNLSHTIHNLRFGQEYPGMVNPLAGVEKHQPANLPSALFYYYAKVVPTSYGAKRKLVQSNQYSVTEHTTPAVANSLGSKVPGIMFFYDFAPLRVDFRNTGKRFLHFLVNLCAIIGGVFAVAGIIDRILHSSVEQVKRAIGKQN